MTGYTLKDLEAWNEKIEQAAAEAGLDCYEQIFEICSYEDMLCYESYAGMPSHYPHWSFGKAYERLKIFYQYNLVGLPYELVINSNPCLAYLMRDNTLTLQVLTMAHVYSHNDFFKNNRVFKRDTRPELTIELFKTHADRVRKYISSPFIGIEQVEPVLNAAHALRFQVPRFGSKHISGRNELKKESEEKIPKRLKDDLLGFLAEKAPLADWQRDLLNIVREEMEYFVPQIETKVMNEGWASYWHYNILNRLGLPEGMHLEFLQRHNMVVRPLEGRINPYYLGFKMFEHLAGQSGGAEKIKEIRLEERDQSFLRRYLSFELCQELNLFSYTIKGNDILVKEISDEAGWETVKNDLIANVGMAAVPVIVPKDVEKGVLVLEHVYDGRELDLTNAKESLKHVVDLWRGKVELRTKLNNKNRLICCGEDKVIIIRDAG